MTQRGDLKAKALAALVALAGVFALAATPASAVYKGAYTFGSLAGGTLGGEFAPGAGDSGPRDIAVNETSQDIYVVDRVNNRIQRFGLDGTFELAFGWDVVESGPGDDTTAPEDEFEICVAADADVCKAGSPGTEGEGPGGQLDRAGGIAIDQSDGSVYVWNSDKIRIEKFDADGHWTLAFGGDVNQTTGGDVCTAASGDTCRTGTTGTAADQLGVFEADNAGIAVHPTTGQVFVSDHPNQRLKEYASDGTFVRAWGWDVVPGGNPTEFEICTTVCKEAEEVGIGFDDRYPGELAIGPNGILYAQDASRNGVQRFDTSESAAADLLLTRITSLVEISLEVDGDDNHLFAHVGGTREYDPVSEEFISFSPISEETKGFGRDSVSGIQYLSFNNVVVVLDEFGAPAPVPATPTGSNLSCHSADLSASVTPNGPAGIQSRAQFELRKTGTAQWLPVGAKIDLGYSTSPVPIAASLSDLEANRGYDVRVTVEKAFGNPSVVSAVNQFSTPACAPEVTTLGAQHISPTSAQLVGRLNPNNQPTTYRVQYGPVGEYSFETPLLDAGTGGTPKAFAVKVTGLSPDTEYQFRFVATNASGTSEGDDRQFRTRIGSQASFRSRVFEMVTPADKNNRRFTETTDGTVLIPNVSSDGESILSGVVFGILDGEAAVGGGFLQSREIFRRGSDGWRTDPLYTAHPVHNNVTPLDGFAAATDDLDVVAMQIKNSIFQTNSTLSTRVFGDTGGPLGNGWYDWLEGNEQFVRIGLNTSGDAAAFDEDGTRMVRWSANYEESFGDDDGAVYRGLLGDADPSGRGYPNEQQEVSVTAATAGSFKLTFNGEQTGAIAYNASAGQVKSALEGLANVAAGQVTVSGSAGGPWTVTFTAGLGRKDHPLMSADSGGLTGEGAQATVAPIRNGVTAPAGTTEQIAGEVVYTQTPVGFGPRELVNECTGKTAAQAIEIPARLSNGDIGVQSCRAGQLTSRRGAVAGTSRALGGTTRGTVSADGARIYFTSPDSDEDTNPNVCAGTLATTHCPAQLFVRQYDSAGNASVRWISRPQVEGQDATLLGPTAFQGASDSGQVVFFQTTSPLTVDDPNGGTAVAGGVKTGSVSSDSWDLYRYELPGDRDTDPNGGTLTRVSGGPGEAYDPSTVVDPGGLSADASLRFLSDDGQRAYFVTRELLGTPSDPWNVAPKGGSAPAAAPGFDARNLYLFDADKSGDERWTFIAQLPADAPIDECAVRGTASGMATSVQNATIARSGVGCLHGTSDGTAIVFEASAEVAPGDADGHGDVYLYDALADELVRVSAPPDEESAYDCGDGNLCNGDIGIDPAARPDQIGRHGATRQNMAVAPDGTLSVYFESRAQLVPEDKNGTFMDVYEWQSGELALVSPGDANHDSYYAGNSLDGEDVFFVTSQSLDPREIDRDWDVYDARIGGGFPFAEPRLPCDPLGGTCRGAVTAPPPAGAPPSANLEGQGNVVEKPRKARCTRKARKRAKGRCAKGKKGAKGHRGRGRR